MRGNVITQIVGSAITIFVLILVTRVSYLVAGQSNYGAFLLVGSLVALAGVVDFGIPKATAYLIAREHNHEIGRRHAMVAAFVASLAPSVLAGCFCLLLTYPQVALSLGISSELSDALSGSDTSLFFVGMLGVLNSTFSGTLQGESRFSLLAAYNTANATLQAVFPLLSWYWVEPSLGGLIVGFAFGRGVICCIGVWMSGVCFVRTATLPSARHLVDLFRYAWGAFLTGLSEAVVNSVDRTVLSALLGANSLPFYAIPQSIFQRLLLLPNAIMTVAFPRFASTSGSSESRMEAKCYQSITMLTPCYVIGICLLPEVLSVWISPDFAKNAATPAAILACASWIDNACLVPYTRIQASSNPARNAAVSAGLLFPYIALFFLCTVKLGVVGAAFACVARSGAYFYFRACRARPPSEVLPNLGMNGLGIIVAVAIQMNETFAVRAVLAFVVAAFLLLRNLREILVINNMAAD